MMYRADLEKARDQFMQDRNAGADDKKAPKFYDDVAEKFNFGQHFYHQKIAFIVVAHRTQTLPYFLAMLSRMGPIASLISKGSHTEEAISQTICDLYSLILSNTITKDQLENDPEKTNDFFSALFSRAEYSDYKFVLIDHGGYFAPRLNDTLLKYSNRILGCVEHTLNGQIDYEKEIHILQDKNPDSALPFFIASVAKNELKVLSDELIGCSIVDALRGEVFSGKTTHQDLNRLSHIAILGYGHLGKSIARGLWPDRYLKLIRQAEDEAIKYKFSICDVQDKALEAAKENHPGALITKDKTLILRDADLIFVATSQKSLTREDFVSLKPGAFIACVTSSDKLFSSDALLDYEMISADTAFKSKAVAFYQHKYTGKIINLVANGSSANFLIGGTANPIMHGIFALVGILANAEITKRIHGKKFSKSIELLPEENTKILKDIWECHYDLLSDNKNQEKINTIINNSEKFARILHYSKEYGLEFQRPPRNDMFVERNDLMKEMVNFFSHKHSSISTLVAVGQGGMGKTQLATRYFYDQEKKYSLRFWFHANSREDLMLQYIELGEAIQQQAYLKNKVFFSEKDSIEVKSKKVKYWLEKQKECLIVYDSVSGPNIIKSLMPESGGHDILITSRNEKAWKNIFRVDVMEEKEAVSLFSESSFSESSDSVRTDEIKTLVNILGRLPLAVMQAGVYIKNCSKTINDYIQDYERRQSELLKDDEFLPELDFIFDKKSKKKITPVWITFDKNLEELEVTCPNALLILQYASFLSSTGIPEFLLNIMHVETALENQVNWDKIKAALSQYSFVNIDPETKQWRMHSLLQDIVRHKLLTIEKIRIFKKVCKHIDSLMIQNNCNDSQFNNTLLTHAERLNEHAQKIAQLPETMTMDAMPKLFAIQPSYLGAYCRRLGLYEKALPLLRQSFELTESYYGKKSAHLLEPLVQLSSILNEFGNYSESLKSLERALSIATNIYGAEHIELSSILTNLGDPRLHSSQEQARNYAQRALSIVEKNYGPYHSKMLAILMNLAETSVDDQSNFKKELLERALTISALYNENREYARILHNLGIIYRDDNELQKSIETLKSALALKEDYFGPNHKDVASTLLELGSTYGQMKNYKKQIELLERSAAILDNCAGQGYDALAVVLLNLATAYRNLNNNYDPRHAITLVETALGIRKELFSPNHGEVGKTLSLLASIYMDLREDEKAAQLLEDSIQIIENYYGVESMSLGAPLSWISIAYLRLGHIDLAISSCKQALIIHNKYLPRTKNELIHTEGLLQFLYHAADSFNSNKEKVSHEFRNKTNFSAYNTWNLAFEAMCQQNAIQAEKKIFYKKILLSIAFFSSKNIPISLLMHITQETEAHVISAFERLYDYALIDTFDHVNKTISVHLNLQEAIKSHLKLTPLSQQDSVKIKNDLDQQYFNILIKLHNIIFNETDFESNKKISCWSNHIISLLKTPSNLTEFKDGAMYIAKIWQLLGYHKNLESNSEQAIDCLQAALVLQERYNGLMYIYNAQIYSAMGLAYIRQMKYSQAFEVLKNALKIYESEPSLVNDGLAVTLDYLAMIYSIFGGDKKATTLINQALAIFKEKNGEEHVSVAKALVHLGKIYFKAGRLIEAKESLARALPILKHNYGEEHIEVYNALFNQASIFESLQDIPNEKRLLENMIILAEGKTHVTSEAKGSVYYRYAKLCSESSDYTLAKVNFEKALPIFRKIYFQKPENIAGLLYDLASTEICLNNYKNAISFYYQALSLLKNTNNDKSQKHIARITICLFMAYDQLHDYPMVVATLTDELPLLESYYSQKFELLSHMYWRMGVAHEKLNENEKAKMKFEQALSCIEKCEIADKEMLTQSLLALANANCRLMLSDQAIATYIRALPIFKDYYGSRHIETAKIYHGLAIAYMQLKDPDANKVHLTFKMALEIKEEHLGKMHIEVGITLRNYANVYKLLEDLKNEKNLLERALLIFEHAGKNLQIEAAEVCERLGEIELKNGETSQAKEKFERAQSIYKKQLPPGDLRLSRVNYQCSMLSQKREFSTYSTNHAPFSCQNYSIARHASLFALPATEMKNTFSSLRKDRRYSPIRTFPCGIFSASPFHSTICRYLPPLLKHIK